MVRCRLLRRVAFGVLILTVIVLWWSFQGCQQACGSTSEVRGSGELFQSPLEGGHLTGRTPVFIVEEHHEVLLYWFDAAERGLIKHEGNVLLHIDGHSDAGSPADMSVLPFSTRPSLRDVYSMMQQNDAFIMAAGLSGLIKRYIWVWPPYGVSEPVVMDHHVIKIQFGTVSRMNDEGSMVQDVCGCVRTYPEGLLSPAGVSCAIASSRNKGEAQTITQESCKIKITDALMEVVSEAKAIELLGTNEWISANESVILDVDEDYYGCEAASGPLFKFRVTKEMVSRISYYIGHLFCPTLPRQELDADKFYARLIYRASSIRQLCVQKQTHKNSPCKNDTANVLLNATESLFDDLLRQDLKSFLCSTDQKAKYFIKGLLKTFIKLTIQQLEVLKEVGICFKTTPRTLTFDPSAGMRICDGYNRPKHSSVRFHTPSEEEITFRTRQLKDMLGSKVIDPGIVTVCRSVRDGYTPRKFAHAIEIDILNVLDASFKFVDKSSIYYDPFLLGGSTGWNSRHKS